MKKIFLILFLGFFTSSLYAQEVEFKVKINIKNYPKENINVVYIAGENIGRFPVAIKNGIGEATIKAPIMQQVSVISMDESNRIPAGRGVIPGPSLYFFADGKEVVLEIDNTVWPAVKMSGGTVNADLNRLFAQTKELEHKEFKLLKKIYELQKNEKVNASQEKQQLEGERTVLKNKIAKYEEQFVADNPTSYVSLKLLAGQSNSMDITTYEKRFKNLSTELRNSDIGKEIATYIATTHSTANGQFAPAFEKKDKDGKNVKLADYKGKYLLIDFWGTWCGPCRSSHPHLVELYHKYNKLGLEFLNVAQENGKDAREKWLAAIVEDNLTWTQVLNNEGKDTCDVVKLFGVTAFPTKVLIDRDGKIINRFIGGSDEIDAVLKRIFKQ